MFLIFHLLADPQTNGDHTRLMSHLLRKRHWGETGNQNLVPVMPNSSPTQKADRLRCHWVGWRQASYGSTKTSFRKPELRYRLTTTRGSQRARRLPLLARLVLQWVLAVPILSRPRCITRLRIQWILHISLRQRQVELSGMIRKAFKFSKFLKR